MIRHTVVEELQWTDSRINGIVLTGYVKPAPTWMFARLEDGRLTVSYITRDFQVRNTFYPKNYEYKPQFIPFPNDMNLQEFRKCHIHKLFIRDFIKEHTGEDL